MNHEDHRRAVFVAPLAVRDAGLSAVDAREEVARRFQLTGEQVEEIECEGVDLRWPPLGG